MSTYVQGPYLKPPTESSLVAKAMSYKSTANTTASGKPRPTSGKTWPR